MLKAFTLLLLLKLVAADMVSAEPADFQDVEGKAVVESPSAYLVDVDAVEQSAMLGELFGFDLLDRAEAWPEVDVDAFQDSQPAIPWTYWVDRQLELLRSLQSTVFGPRCGMVTVWQDEREVPLPSATAPQSLLTHMAAARFGPAILNIYNSEMSEDGQQVETTLLAMDSKGLRAWSGGAEDWAVLTSRGSVPSGVAPFLDAWLQAVLPPGGMQYVGYASTYEAETDYDDFNAFDAAYDATEDGLALVPFTSLRPIGIPDYAHDEFLDPAATDWEGNKLEGTGEDSRGLDLGFLLFVWLCTACTVVWAMLIRSYCALARLSCPTCPSRARQADFLEVKQSAGTAAALLAPLDHENPLAERQAYGVQVAADHARDSEPFVTIQYVPLKGDMEYRL